MRDRRRPNDLARNSVAVGDSMSALALLLLATPRLWMLGGKTLADVTLRSDGQLQRCALHELDEEADAEPLVKASGLPVHRLGFQDMLQLVNNCTQLEVPSNSTTDNQAWPLWNGIAPGTVWCGVGDVAEDFSSLGRERLTDACCRAHDHCPVKLKAFRAGYGLLNLSLYTKSHCDCDREFHSCLRNSRRNFSDLVGNFYFNFMRVPCLKESKNLVCVANRTDAFGVQSCAQWNPDPTQGKMEVSNVQLKY